MQVQIHRLERGSMALNRALEADPASLSKWRWETFLGWVLTLL